MRKNKHFGGLYMTKRTMKLLKQEKNASTRSVNEVVRYSIFAYLRSLGYHGLDYDKDVKFR
jgi:hypothetical protein